MLQSIKLTYESYFKSENEKGNLEELIKEKGEMEEESRSRYYESSVRNYNRSMSIEMRQLEKLDKHYLSMKKKVDDHFSDELSKVGEFLESEKSMDKSKDKSEAKSYTKT